MMRTQSLLQKIMPQHTGWILDYPNICRNIRFVILYQWPVFIVLVEQLAKLIESRKSPVAFLRVEAMVRIYRPKYQLLAEERISNFLLKTIIGVLTV